MTMRMRMMMKGPQLLSTIALLSAVRPHHRSSSLLASAFFTSRVSHHHTIRMMASSTTTTTSNINQTQILQDALYRIRDVNHVPPHIRESLIPFCVDGRVVGQVTPAKAQVLVDCPPAVFELVTESSSSTSSSSSSNPILTLSSHCGSTPEERTAAIAQVTDQLRQQGLIPGWRNELFPVAASFDEAPLFLMERAAVPSLGVLEYGIHINGIVQATNNDNTHTSTQMWMARRSLTKSKHPGMLDQMVAGGQPAGLSLLENCRKECAEEAGIPPHLTHRIVPAGAISYEQYIPSSDTLSRVVLFNFDLPLPADFIPTPVDGEVEEFFLWTVPELLQSLSPDFPDPLKPNCYVVVIDWLVRQGHLSPDTPGYLDVLRELRSGDCQ